MKVFDASIEQLLWPEKREREPGFDGYIARTTEQSYVQIPKRSVPVELQNLVGWLPANPFHKVFDKDGNFKLGPIPKGFPINIAANFQSRFDIPFGKRLAHDLALTQLVFDAARNWPSLDLQRRRGDARPGPRKLRMPLRTLLKCPDFVVNRGHYFGTDAFNATDGLSDDEKAFGKEPALSDDDKRALIAYLKTF